jgi:hypothetical protein
MPMAGDVVLVNVTAHYPAVGRHPARQVRFLEFIHITDKQLGRWLAVPPQRSHRNGAGIFRRMKPLTLSAAVL